VIHHLKSTQRRPVVDLMTATDVAKRLLYSTGQECTNFLWWDAR